MNGNSVFLFLFTAGEGSANIAFLERRQAVLFFQRRREQAENQTDKDGSSVNVIIS